MSLESCPICGYALSVHDHHCRHCLPSHSALAKAGVPSINRLLNAKQLPAMIITAVVLSVLAYLIFFR